MNGIANVVTSRVVDPNPEKCLGLVTIIVFIFPANASVDNKSRAMNSTVPVRSVLRDVFALRDERSISTRTPISSARIFVLPIHQISVTDIAMVDPLRPEAVMT